MLGKWQCTSGNFLAKPREHRKPSKFWPEMDMVKTFQAWGGVGFFMFFRHSRRQKVALLGGHCANSGAVVQPPLGATMGPLLGMWDGAMG